MTALDGKPLGTVTNLISQNADGELLLTFTFAFGPRDGVLDEGPEAEATEAKQVASAKEAVSHTIQVIRTLVESGEIKA